MNPHLLRYCIFRLRKLYIVYNKIIETFRIKEKFYKEFRISMLQIFNLFLFIYIYIYIYICRSEMTLIAEVTQQNCI